MIMGDAEIEEIEQSESMAGDLVERGDRIECPHVWNIENERYITKGEDGHGKYMKTSEAYILRSFKITTLKCTQCCEVMTEREEI